METVKLALDAMNTRFEMVLHGGNASSLRAAGEEAFREVERLEAALSLFRLTSEIAHINARAAREPVRTSPEVFDLLRRAVGLSRLTDGAFDITVGPLLHSWGFLGGEGHLPDAVVLQEARLCVGADKILFDEAGSAVRFERPGVMVDLGGIGKGYALDMALEILEDAGVESALLHGGTSTTVVLGTQPDGAPWKVGVQAPANASGAGPESLAVVSLEGQALSVSAGAGRAFQADGHDYGHVFDPRLGRPVTGALSAAVMVDSATDADALSTALLVMGKAGLEHLAVEQPDFQGLVLEEVDGVERLESIGFDDTAIVKSDEKPR